MRWPLDGPLWYLYAVFLLAVFSPVLIFLFKDKRIAWLVVVIFIILIEARGYYPPQINTLLKYGYIPNVLYYLPSFLIGAYLGKFIDELNTVEIIRSILYVMLLFYLLQGIFNNCFYSIVLKVMPILLVFFMPNISQLNECEIYNLTFLMYALHSTILGDFGYRIVNILAEYQLPKSVENLIFRILVLCLDVVISWIIYKILNRKRLSPILYLITGGRN